MKRGRPKASTKKDNRSFGPLGDLIRKHRIEQKMGLSDLSKACGCSVQFISNIEHGRAPLPWEKSPHLAKVLKISLDEIQVANLAIRSDFKNLAGFPAGKRVAKPLILKHLASIIALASKDAPLQEVIQKYQAASEKSRSKFVKTALDILSH